MARSLRDASRPLTLVTAALAVAAATAASVSAQNALDPRPRDNRPIGSQAGQGGGRLGGPANQNPLFASPGRRTGGGNALDANLQVGSGGINAAGPRQDFYARNFIVTDSVAGGRGFRGTVGYLAAGDFAGQTASDSTFAFRSNAATSSPVFIGSPLYQDRFSIAQNLGLFEYRREASQTAVIPNASEFGNRRLRLDQATSALSAGRINEFFAEAVPFAVGQDANERRVEFLSSPVQGMRMRRLDDGLQTQSISTFEKARARRDLAEGLIVSTQVVAPFGGGPLGEELRVNTQVVGEPMTRDQQDRNASAYDEVVRRLLLDYGDNPNVNIDADPATVARIKKDLATLREALGGPRPATPRGGAAPPEDPDIDPITKLPRRPGANAPTEPDAGDQPSLTPAPREDSEEAIKARKIEEAKDAVRESAGALRHGTTISDLSPGQRARVDELVREAQDRMADGDFFKAERSFDQALTLQPDSPLLMAGLANAQLGAGLYLSSALTLRSLFAQNPEMIDSRYEARLLPNETRLRLAIETLRERIRRGSDADGYGLALAYIGHQMNNRALVEEGLVSVTGSSENDLLRELVTQIWLGERRPQQ